jgi:hypothetical protein
MLLEKLIARSASQQMEPEGSLSCSQQPATSPYSQPDESNPGHQILLP